MNNIDQLLKKYCPNGVKIKKLSDILEYEQPNKYIFKSTKYDNSYVTPVLTPGKTFILGYTNETNGIYNATKNKPIIIFDDFTTYFHWIDFNFKVKSSAIKILKPINRNTVNFRYIYYSMKIINYITTEHKRQWIQTYSNIEIPIPPIEIQNKIAEILDNFSELEAELEFRNIQYEHYNNKLLDFDNNQSLLRKLSNDNFLNKEVKSYKLKDISKINIGQQLNKELFNNGEYFVYNGGVDPSGKYDKWNVEENHIAISQGGESAGNVKFIKEKFWAGAHCYYIFSNNEEKYNQKYLYYFLKNEQPNLANKANGVAIKGLSKSALEDFEIKVPSIEIQNRIVRVLEKLETYNKDVNTGLPAELNARKSQYDYYLNKLLTFKTGGAIGSEQLECLKFLENIFLYIVEYKRVGELCDITRGKVYSKDYIKNNIGIYPVYSSQTENNGELGKINTYDFDGEYVTWTTDGAYAGSTFYRNGKFSITNVCGLLKVKNFNELVPKYLHYILKINTHNYVNGGSGNPKLMSNVMANIVLPIPSLEIQNKIVQILDKLELYTKDINTGLPLEVSERKKQYNYYLNKLLTFKTGGGK